MKRSAIPDQILQQIDNVIGVWQENRDFSMGPDVTPEKLKATRVQLDACITDVQATNRTLTKQIGDRDDCAKLGNEYVVRARKAIQGYSVPIPRNTPRLAAPARATARPGAAAPRSRRCPRRHKASQPRAPAGLPIPGTRGACRRDVGHGRKAPARRREAVERRHAVGRGGVLPPEQRPTVVRGCAVPGWHPAPGRSFSKRGACSRKVSLEEVLMRIDVPVAQPESSMSRNLKAYKRLAIVHRTPSKRAKTARSSSRVNTTDRLAGSLGRPIPRGRLDPSLDICR